MINDHVADMIARIKNAQRAGHKYADVTVSKLNKGILEVLRREGMIEAFELVEGEVVGGSFRVALKYYERQAGDIARRARVTAW